jgi:hypothetical protein
MLHDVQPERRTSREEKELFRNQKGRAGFRALAATVAIAGTLLALGTAAAQASTVQTGAGQDARLTGDQYHLRLAR